MESNYFFALPQELQDLIVTFAGPEHHKIVIEKNLQMFKKEMNIKGFFPRSRPFPKKRMKNVMIDGLYCKNLLIWNRGHDVKLFDHIRVYLCHDGRIIIVNSPYAPPQKVESKLKAFGFIPYSKPLYNEMATTYYQIF